MKDITVKGVEGDEVRCFQSVNGRDMLIGAYSETDGRHGCFARVPTAVAADLAWSILEMQGKAKRPEEPIKAGDFVKHQYEGSVTHGKVIFIGDGIANLAVPGLHSYLTVSSKYLTRLSAHEFTEAIAEIVNRMTDND